MKTAKTLVCTVSLLALAACHTNRPLVSAHGPTLRTSASNYGAFQIFRLAHAEAFEKAGGLQKVNTDTEIPYKPSERDTPERTRIKPGVRPDSDTGKSDRSGDGQAARSETEPTDKPAETGPPTVFQEVTKEEDEASRRMLFAGFDLIRANCGDFFDQAGRNQGRTNLYRDIVVVSAGFLSSAIALNPGNTETQGALPILTTAAYSGIDAYNSNFLFAAENVGVVRTLTIRAVQVHQNEWWQEIGDQPLSYGRALDILVDNQSYCLPPKILQLVKGAINVGNVQRVEPAAPKEPKFSVAGAKTLGEALSLPGGVSEEQAAALYWLLFGDTTPADRAAIAKRLEGLGDAQPLDGDKLKEKWPRKAVEDVFKALGADDRAGLNAAVTRLRRAVVAERSSEKAAIAGTPPKQLQSVSVAPQ